MFLKSLKRNVRQGISMKDPLNIAWFYFMLCLHAGLITLTVHCIKYCLQVIFS